LDGNQAEISRLIYGRPRTRTSVNATHAVISDAMACDVTVSAKLSVTAVAPTSEKVPVDVGPVTGILVTRTSEPFPVSEVLDREGRSVTPTSDDVPVVFPVTPTSKQV